jgi:hypothetical protein
MYPMAGTNPESRSWISSLKNSVTSACSKALAYCSLQKTKDVTDLVRNNPGMAAGIFAAATGGAWGTWSLYKMYKNRERETLAPWSSLLKKVPCKLNNRNEDDVHAWINLSRIGTRNGTLIYYQQQNQTPIKHAGLTITKRRNDLGARNKVIELENPENTNVALHQKLIRYTLEDNMPEKIHILSLSNNVNEMIVRQKAKHLAHAVLYVTLKSENQEKLNSSNVTFHPNSLGDLDIMVNDQPFGHGITPIDIELHIPEGIKIPEIVYSTQQIKPLLQIQK